MKYKFKAKDLKTGEWVKGDLVYVQQLVYKKGIITCSKEVPMIVKLHSHGGMVWCHSRYSIDESTLELLKE